MLRIDDLVSQHVASASLVCAVQTLEGRGYCHWLGLHKGFEQRVGVLELTALETVLACGGRLALKFVPDLGDTISCMQARHNDLLYLPAQLTYMLSHPSGYRLYLSDRRPETQLPLMGPIQWLARAHRLPQLPHRPPSMSLPQFGL